MSYVIYSSKGKGKSDKRLSRYANKLCLIVVSSGKKKVKGAQPAQAVLNLYTHKSLGSPAKIAIADFQDGVTIGLKPIFNTDDIYWQEAYQLSKSGTCYRFSATALARDFRIPYNTVNTIITQDKGMWILRITDFEALVY